MGLGMFHAGLLLWEPTQYASLIGGFNPWNVILLIWAMCTSMVVGVGFIPHRFAFKLLFNPYCSLVILLIFTAILLL
jgi:cyd operon protein YbgE